MDGLSPETWPILAAFLVLQTLITFPLVRYIKIVHDQQIALLQKLYDAAQGERAALLKQVEVNSEKMWQFTDAMRELRAAVAELARARRGE